jgi:hypothetical protein
MVKRYLHRPKPGFLYVRVKGIYLGRITAPEGTAEFDSQYWNILNGRTLRSPTSWSALITSYRRSHRWTCLKSRTRSTYERVLIYLDEKNGGKDATRLQRKDVIAAQHANRHRSKFANDIPAILSVLCEHAIDIGWMASNPAKGVKKIPTPKEKQRPHVPWTNEAVAKWRALASPLPRLIFEIGVGSVQRPGDWVDFVWGDYDGDCLKLHQNKTGTFLVLPCTDQLKTALGIARLRLKADPHPSSPIIVGNLVTGLLTAEWPKSCGMNVTDLG